MLLKLQVVPDVHSWNTTTVDRNSFRRYQLHHFFAKVAHKPLHQDSNYNQSIGVNLKIGSLVKKI